MLHGEQGSAKSTLQELIKMLVDPSSVRTLTFPRDINELIQLLSHHYVPFLIMYHISRNGFQMHYVEHQLEVDFLKDSYIPMMKILFTILKDV